MPYGCFPWNGIALSESECDLLPLVSEGISYFWDVYYSLPGSGSGLACAFKWKQSMERSRLRRGVGRMASGLL
jgi:hypothetical protein